MLPTASQLGVHNAFDPQAKRRGEPLLGKLLERQLRSDQSARRLQCGPQRIDQYHGVPPYYETHKAYVARIVRDFNKKKPGV